MTFQNSPKLLPDCLLAAIKEAGLPQLPLQQLVEVKFEVMERNSRPVPPL